MAHNRKQHYIPRCYLRKFSNNQTHIFTYDKVDSKQYRPNINDVCTVNNFYDLSDNNLTDGIGGKLIECDFFANTIEIKYGEFLKNLIGKKDQWIEDRSQNMALSHPEKDELAQYIAIQFFRLPQYRNYCVSTEIELAQKEAKIIQHMLAYINSDPNFLKLDYSCECEDEAYIHANNSFLDNKKVQDYANAMAANYWEFLVSEDGYFYTSDFPIISEPHQNTPSIYNGLAQLGSEVTFPISKDILLVMRDRRYFEDKVTTDCQFVNITKNELQMQNALRYCYANRKVFSYDKDFMLIEVIKYKNNNEHIFDRWRSSSKIY